jgi:epoxyqueuosine reductase
MTAMLDVRQRALEIGFDLAGVAPLAAWDDLEFSRRWVERGFGGEMRYLSNPKRYDPRTILPSAQSVVGLGMIYNAPLPYSTEAGGREPGAGSQDKRQWTTDDGPRAWISRYAWGRDYHEIMRAKLEQLRTAIANMGAGVETRVFVDTGPIVERAFARLSGIGWMGKNTCLINQQKGSWFFLGVILTNLALAPDLPAPDRCGSCTACLEACPTGALVEPYVMDASRCISYLNIELKGSIPEEFRAAMGNNVFGCDICQDVCPWNSRQSSAVSRQLPDEEYERKGAATTALAELQPMEPDLMHPDALSSQRTTDDGPRTDGRVSNFEFRFSLFNPPLEALASLSEDDFRRVFARSPIKRAKYRGWLRNLCVAMGNSGDARFVPRLQELAAHADPLVREHAAWALERLR